MEQDQWVKAPEQAGAWDVAGFREAGAVEWASVVARLWAPAVNVCAQNVETKFNIKEVFHARQSNALRADR